MSGSVMSDLETSVDEEDGISNGWQIIHNLVFMFSKKVVDKFASRNGSYESVSDHPTTSSFDGAEATTEKEFSFHRQEEEPQSTNSSALAMRETSLIKMPKSMMRKRQEMLVNFVDFDNECKPKIVARTRHVLGH